MRFCDNNSYYARGYAEGAADTLNAVNIQYSYHVHLDSSGNEQNADYQASTSGGCFTKENIVYTTTTGICGNNLYNAGSTTLYDDVKHEYVTAYNYNCPIHGTREVQGDNYSGICNFVVTKQVDTGERYYTVNCGKTTDSIETAIIVFD